ncbi:MAG: MATE family efflux transporter [Oscillospiraceae bacterium]|nr:MATE family efflux transporter [Oscillospiraceae bacterium]
MKIQLSDHFTYKKLLRFTAPPIAMMIFTSIYGVVDGFFVSNFAGKTPFAAVNFIMPFLMILGSFGFMFGTGGSALISYTMGEGDMEKANSLFSMLTYISLGFSVAISLLGMVFIRPLAAALGAEGEMLDICVIYGRIILAALPAFMLQMEFQSFFVTAEKPQLGLYMTLISGIANMVLDALFIMAFDWGIIGAAVATAVSQVLGGITPMVYFFRENDSLLRLGKMKYDAKGLLRTCTNGSSELLSNMSMSLVGMLYNVQLMKYAGENGVAAYGVMMNLNLVFLGAFIGYAIGTAPVIGFHYGAGNHKELKSILKKSLLLIGICSVGMFLLGELLSRPLSVIFVGYDDALLRLTHDGFQIYSFMFLFVGIAIFGSSFFTALNNGLIFAIISFLRTLVFQVAAILLLPLVWDVNGIWASVVAAELMAALLAGVFLLALRKKYKY